VWSFGIGENNQSPIFVLTFAVLWEIFSRGMEPYGIMSNDQVMKEVKQGYRMSPPPDCPKEIAQLMQQCWKFNTGDRPSFQVLTLITNKTT